MSKYKGFSKKDLLDIYSKMYLSRILDQKQLILLKQGKALRFDKQNEDLVKKKKDELNKKNIETKNKFIEVAKKINNKTFTFNRESKENGELYGTIKPKEITNQINLETETEVGPSQIVLKDNLNKIGLYSAEINFHAEVKAKISIKVEKIKSK